MITALGSACNDARDAQNINFPSVIPVIFSTFFLVPVIKDPNSTLAVILSLIPTSTPLLMMLRQIMPTGVPAWQLLLGVVNMVVFTLALVWLGGRIFRIGILLQGKAPTLGTMVRWAAKG
ncbi:ABC transporter permease [candidate division KSB1 bacterium]|nr:ABC transporter permease [candidate division KSB1 bacterium]